MNHVHWMSLLPHLPYTGIKRYNFFSPAKGMSPVFLRDWKHNCVSIFLSVQCLLLRGRFVLAVLHGEERDAGRREEKATLGHGGGGGSGGRGKGREKFQALHSTGASEQYTHSWKCTQ